MFKKIKSQMNWQMYIKQMPHCDQRVLHAPGECEYCDKHPEWQALRLAWGIAFTNWEPEMNELPCPANHVRGDKVNGWAGNLAKKSGEPTGYRKAGLFMGLPIDLPNFGGKDVSTNRKD